MQTPVLLSRFQSLRNPEDSSRAEYMSLGKKRQEQIGLKLFRRLPELSQNFFVLRAPGGIYYAEEFQIGVARVLDILS
jgi:hypothetical protein